MSGSAVRRLVVYEREGKVRAEYRAERDEPRPKKGENVLASADVEILSDPLDSLTDVWDALDLGTTTEPRTLAQRIIAYGAARKSAGVARSDDFDVEPFSVDGTIREKMLVVAAVAKVWGKAKAQEQAEALGVRITTTPDEKPKKIKPTQNALALAPVTREDE